MKFSLSILLIIFVKITYGQLTYIDKVYQNQGGIEGIYRPNSIAISPDNKHLYAISFKKSIGIFEILPSGGLEYIDYISDDYYEVPGIKGIYELRFNPEGNYAYGANMEKNSLMVFERDPISGILNSIQNIDNNNADSSLVAVTGISVSSDGRYIYTISQRSNRIGIFQCDQTTGILTFENTVNTHLTDQPIDYSCYLTESHDSKNIYLGSYSNRSIVVFQRDNITGALTYSQKLVNYDDTNSFTVIDNFILPKSFVISKNDKYMYAFSRFGVNILERDISNGNLTPIDFYEISNFPNNPNSSLFPNSGDISEDGENLFVSLNYDDIVLKFKIDTTTGSITADTIIHDDNNNIYPDNRTGHRSILVNKDISIAYVASHFDNSITIIDTKNSTTGMEVIDEIIYGIGGLDNFNYPRSMAITKNKKFVFATSDDDQSITSFSRNQITGSLEYLNTTICNTNPSCRFPKLIISNDTKNIYTCTYNGSPNAIYVYSLDSSNGNTNYLQTIPNWDSGTYGTYRFIDMLSSFDNKNIYALTENDKLKIYSRNLVTGELTFNHNINIDPGDATAFLAHDIIISKDDKYIYIFSDYDIKVYSRNITTGDLSLIQTIDCHADIPNTMIYYNDGVLSHDQTSLFLANSYAPFLIEYHRNTNNGLLEFYKTYADNDSISSAYSICINSDSKDIYLGAGELKIGVLSLNPNIGVYEIVRTIKGKPLMDYGASMRDLLITESNQNLYALSSNDKSITNFGPSFFFETNINICEGETYEFNGNTYSISGTYCDTSFSTHSYDSIIKINLNIHPTFLLSQTKNICEGNTYDFNGQNYSTSGVYYDSLTTIHGCDSIYELSLIVNPIDTISQSIVICQEDSYNFYGTALNTEGIYYHSLTSTQGCDSVIIAKVSVNPLPTVTGSQDTNVYIGNTLQLSAIGDGDFEWTPPDYLDNPYISDPKSTPMNSITYTVIVTDTNGCTNSDIINIVAKASNVWIPNIFNPNNPDPLNQAFYVRGKSIKDLEIIIYNRWGEKVFKTNDIKQGWDGTHKGKTLQTGVYMYYVKAYLYNGDKIERKGDVTLTR